jgi:hypothetical protein
MWLKKVEKLFYEATSIELSAEEWTGYYDSGLSPKEAVSEEISIMADNI